LVKSFSLLKLKMANFFNMSGIREKEMEATSYGTDETEKTRLEYEKALIGETKEVIGDYKKEESGQ